MKRLILQVLLTCSAVLLLASVAMAANTYTPAGTTITNTASVTFQDANGTVQTPPSPATATVTVTQIYGVIVSPGTDAKNVSDGLSGYYPITVTNNGNGTDSFTASYANTITTWTPTGVSFVTANDNSDVAITNQLTNMAQNATVTIYMKVAVPNTAFTGDVELATATIADTHSQSATDACTTTAAGSDFLGNSTKTSSTSTPVVGVPFTYTINVINSGTQNATTVVVTDPIPANMTYVAGSIHLNGTSVPDATVEGGTIAYTGGTVTINLGTVNHGVTDTITFQAQVNSGVNNNTSITNTATVSYDSGLYSTQPAVTVTAKGVPSLTLTKTADKANAAPGATVTYTITATNGSASTVGPANNVIISDTIPANTTFVSGSIYVDGVNDSGNADKSGSTISTPPATVAPGGTKILVFSVTVN